jgi:hypothetical protein
MRVQAFASDLAVEGFHEGVVSWLSWRRKVGLVTVWFRSLAYHYATFASKAKGLTPPRYE